MFQLYHCRIMENRSGSRGWICCCLRRRSDQAKENKLRSNKTTEDEIIALQNNSIQEQVDHQSTEEDLLEKVQATSDNELDFDKEPTFVKTIRTKAAKKESKAIFGLTILNAELFVISQHSPDVEVYDSDTLAFNRTFPLKGLYDPVDIKASSKHHCLYIFDWIEVANEILRVASDGKLIGKWNTGSDGGYISVTLEGNVHVLLSVWDKSLLKEFSAEGELLREIQLSASVNKLRLAVEIPRGHFVISQGEDSESDHRVCLVDDKGVVMKYIGEKQGTSNGAFDSPNYMAVDRSGFVLVADQNNRRVVLLNPALEFKKEVIQEGDGLRYPVRVHLDQATGRLYIADNDHLEYGTGWRDGRVLAFDFAIRQTS